MASQKKTPTVKTQANLEKSLKKLTSPKQPKKTGKTSGTTRKRVKQNNQLKLTASKNIEWFPYEMFPIRLENKTEKRICHFQCEEHAQKYIDRYKCDYQAYYLKN